MVAGVAVYVGLVYLYWDDFRAYFDWAESLAITVKVRFK